PGAAVDVHRRLADRLRVDRPDVGQQLVDQLPRGPGDELLLLGGQLAGLAVGAGPDQRRQQDVVVDRLRRVGGEGLPPHLPRPRPAAAGRSGPPGPAAARPPAARRGISAPRRVCPARPGRRSAGPTAAGRSGPTARPRRPPPAAAPPASGRCRGRTAAVRRSWRRPTPGPGTAPAPAAAAPSPRPSPRSG